MEHMNLKYFLDEYCKYGKYVCVSGKTGKKLFSSENRNEFKEKFYNREVLSLEPTIVLKERFAYPVVKIWISEYDINY